MRPQWKTVLSLPVRLGAQAMAVPAASLCMAVPALARNAPPPDEPAASGGAIAWIILVCAAALLTSLMGLRRSSHLDRNRRQRLMHYVIILVSLFVMFLAVYYRDMLGSLTGG